MKALLVVFCFLMAVNAYSEEIEEDAVPSTVRSSFVSQYPKAEDVEWEKEGEHFEVDFEVNETEMSLIIDRNGTILEKETEISVEELPSVIRENLAAAYPGYEIKKAEKVEKDGEIIYEVEIEKRMEVTYSVAGTVIAEETGSGDDDGEHEDEEDDDSDDDDDDD